MSYSICLFGDSIAKGVTFDSSLQPKKRKNFRLFNILLWSSGETTVTLTGRTFLIAEKGNTRPKHLFLHSAEYTVK